MDPEDARAYRAHLNKAEKGNAGAQCDLARCLRTGKGVARDAAQAAVWCRKAAVQGHAGAQSDLGSFFKHGEGVAQDNTQAMLWYRKAAVQGYAPAQAALSCCFKSGIGVAQDDAQAAVWIRKAAEQGYAGAQYNLAVCLVKGDGVARDAEQAVVWIRKAAEQGFVRAQCNLGLLLLEGAEGVPKDVKAGAHSLAAAAQQGHAEALAALAEHAGKREVAQACCLGCGATDALKICDKCLVASFCGKECVVRMWPVHKPHCKCWREAAKTGPGLRACSGQ